MRNNTSPGCDPCGTSDVFMKLQDWKLLNFEAEIDNVFVIVLPSERMPYETVSFISRKDVRVVDIRTDTITKPTPAMRKVMAVAEVGDSVFGEDPTVNKLERRCAELLGKEDAVYLPSGTMCNLIARAISFQVLPLEWIDNVAEIARQNNIPIHMDGARLMHAVVQSGVSAKRIARDMDSVFFCLSKGLACPMGSVMAGILPSERMPYETVSFISRKDVRVVDIRTDTITKPTPAMRKVMAVAEVGDSVFGEDPTVNKLERRCAELLGKEDAVYLPSGTMCNLIAIMVYCSKHGTEFIAGDRSHTFLYEQGGAAFLAGVQCSLIPNHPDGTFSLDLVKERIRVNTDFHEPSTALIIIENTHNMCGGKVLPLEWIDNVAEIARQNNIPIHMDGARLMHAVVQSGVSAKRIARDMDSVFFCLSKGLACPMGSVMAGSKNFITQAKRLRKMLGGGVRQVGILAAAGLLALDEMIDRLRIDHDHVYQIAQAIYEMDSPVFRVDLSSIQTNILMIYLDTRIISSKQVLQKLAMVADTDEVQVSVQAGAPGPSIVRLVLHWEITQDDVLDAIRKIKMVIKEVESEM
ncbi:hypothetical protein FQR65_LT08626 [Abscondita terminalis]|nr:hypothetical protein FQR65_LT08626 [Abscondita terminalis]